MSETNKTKGKAKLIIGIIIVLIVILVIIGFMNSNSTESTVKNTKVQDISIGDALDSYCDETSWKEFSKEENSANGKKVLSGVRFKGTQKYDKGNTVFIDFIIDKDEVWIDGMWESEHEVNDEEFALEDSFSYDEMADFLTNALKKHADDKGTSFNENDSNEKVLNMIYYTDFERKLPEQKIYGIRLEDFLTGINEGQLHILYGDNSVTYELNLSVSGLSNKADKTGIFSSLVNMYDSIGAFDDTKLTIRFFDSNYFESSDDSFYTITRVIRESGGNSEELTKEDAVKQLSSLVCLYCMANDIQYDEDECTNELETRIDIESKDSSEETENQQTTEESATDGGETEIGDETEEDTSDAEFENDEDYEDVGSNADYILPESDRAYITKTDIEGFSKEDLRFAKNELYARHGYIFNSKDLNDYFENYSWYKKKYNPTEWNKAGGDNAFFNKYEIANRDLLVKEFNKK